MSDLHQFLMLFYQHLIGKTPPLSTNLIRIHSKKLSTSGDLSFPLGIKSWFSYVDGNVKKEIVNTVFEYLHSEANLVDSSKLWALHLSKISIVEDNVLVFLDRKHAFQTQIRKVLKLGPKYGSEMAHKKKYILVAADETNQNLTSVKSKMIEKVVKNCLAFIDVSLVEDENILKTCKDETVIITSCSTKGGRNRIILVGAVLNEKGIKDTVTTIDELYDKRSIDMRLMAEHKYGVRTTLGASWKEFFRELGRASVIVHMLQNKPQHTTTIKLNDASGESTKAASFILYNCARVSTLLKNFEKRVTEKLYPNLPNIEDIQFELLNEPEEWELLFVYILQFPRIVENCIRDVEKGRVNPHYLVAHLQNLSSVFSVYYRRVRILMEPREHLFAVIFERIYLVKALHQVFNNGLLLLDIQPVNQM